MKKTKSEDTVTYKITQAVIKDEFCNYTTEITSDLNKGDKAAIKGAGIIKESLKKAFNKLSVHLAIIDDNFRNSKVEIDKVDKFHNHEITRLYSIDGFRVKGEEDADNEVIVIMGSKYVSTGNGQITLQSPPIALDRLSGYAYHKELKKVLDNCIEEVKLYRSGNYIPVELPEEEDENQLSIADELE